MAYRKFPFSISFDNFAEDIKPMIKEIRPLWDVEDLKIKRMHGGISNILFGVYYDRIFTEGETDMVLLRVYGKVLLDRDIEMINMSALSKFNLAAKVWGQFDNGCCYQFIHGSMMNTSSVWDPKIYKLIINEFVKLHTVKLDIDRPKEPFLFHKMREMAHYLPSVFEDPEKNEQYQKDFPKKEKVYEEIKELEEELVRLNCPVTFCHNDLLVRNMVLNERKDRIHMIDFEYADYNYCAFDLGNHFNEYAGLDNVDFSQYPDKPYQMVWLRQYLEALYLTKVVNGDITDERPISVDEEEVERWYRMTNKFSLASHLFWCIWAIWQEMHSAIDFDYLSYAILRWNEYITRRKQYSTL